MNQVENIQVCNKISICDIDLDNLNNDELRNLQKEIDIIFKLREIISSRKDIMIQSLKDQIEKKKKSLMIKMKREISEEQEESNEESEEKPVRATRRKIVAKKK